MLLLAVASQTKKGKTITELVESVESGKAFSEWRKGNKGACLSSAFVMAKGAAELEQESGAGAEWLLSYYDKEDDTFTTFGSLGSQKAAKEQAFKEGRTLPQLNPGLVKVEVWDGIKAAEGVRLSKYKGEEATRVIAILQPLTGEEIFDSGSSDGGDLGKGSEAIPVWNLTYITSAYNILNIKIDARTGKVLSDRMSGVMDFTQKDQKD